MNVEGLLVDLDGRLYVGDEPIPGAVEAMGRIVDASIPFRYVINTTRKPRRAVAEALREHWERRTSDADDLIQEGFFHDKLDFDPTSGIVEEAQSMLLLPEE